MVAAGVYMLCRVFFLLNVPNSNALMVIAAIGGFTALLAAVIAVQQNDIKRILAYSTLSQLGYMVMGVGVGSPAQSMFHLTTHAFFKALLFLGAGSVIVALHHEQDIWKMGDLRKKMPVTFWTFLAGTLALAGVWPMSGFFSKDALLAQAAEHHKYGLFALGEVVALLTSFYIFRLVFVVFYGSANSERSGHAHESPSVMLWPLRFLAVLTVIGGFFGIEALDAKFFSPEHPMLQASFREQLIGPFIHETLAATLGLLAALAGFAGAYFLYFRAAHDPLPEKLGAFGRAMQNRFYFDEIYEATVIRIHDFLSAVADGIDRWVIEGFFVGSVRGGTNLAGSLLRLLQTGNLQTYAFLFALGVAIVLYLALR
jgi:NADH-quinone oxidoreductase subunit L